MFAAIRHWAMGLIAVCIACLSFYLGRRSMPEAEPIVITKTVVDKQVQERVVTVTKRPDGTEETRTEERQVSETRKDSNTTTPNRVATSLPRYSVAVTASNPYSDLLSKPQWEFMGYRRIGDTNLWLGAGYGQKDQAVLLGLRIDF